MRQIYEVLLQKEVDLQRVRKELAALRVVAPLLASDSQPEAAQQPEMSVSADAVIKPFESTAEQRQESSVAKAVKTSRARISRQFKRIVRPVLDAPTELSENAG